VPAPRLKSIGKDDLHASHFPVRASPPEQPHSGDNHSVRSSAQCDVTAQILRTTFNAAIEVSLSASMIHVIRRNVHLFPLWIFISSDIDVDQRGWVRHMNTIYVSRRHTCQDGIRDPLTLVLDLTWLTYMIPHCARATVDDRFPKIAEELCTCSADVRLSSTVPCICRC
jgi:hypothetical protein